MFIKKRLILGFVLVITCCILLGCKNNDKEIILSRDVSKQVKQQEKEINQSVELGNGYLKQQKYDNARKAYEEAISKDYSHKKIYLEIKDKYVEKSRFDDAYYIIKLAINNNVDVDNMNKILDEIKKNFEMINLESKVYQGDSYTLPQKVNLEVNGQQIQAGVKWDKTNIDTSNDGTFTYIGTIDQYGRSVQQKLIVETKGELYKFDNLGFSITFPESWKGKYSIKQDDDGIKVYFKSSNPYQESRGYLFGVLKKSDKLDEPTFDTVSAKMRYVNIKGITYVTGGPTGVDYSDKEQEYDIYIKMCKESYVVVETIKALP